MTTDNTREFKRTLRLLEQSDDALLQEEMTLETALVKFLRTKSSHALSEFLRGAVTDRFVKESLALVANKSTDVQPLEPAVQSYINNNFSNGGAS